jgi:hypothetical protein
MEKRWRVNLGDNTKKVELLGLTFVSIRLGITLEKILNDPLIVPTSIPEEST